MAIAPEARMLPKITKSTSTGPRIAPTAPNNFQSPAPSPRNKTSGSSRPKASNAPSSANSVPCHPESTVCTVKPATSPGTVSQLGIRRERKSSKAAVIVNTRLIVQIIPAACMGSFFLSLLCGSASGAGLKTCHHGRAVAKAVLRIARLGIQVGCGGREDSIDRRCQSSQSPNRREGEQNEKECILRQVLAFLVLPQLLNHIFHSRSSRNRILSLGYPRFVSVGGCPQLQTGSRIPPAPLREPNPKSGYYVAFRLPAALVNTPLIAVARVPRAPIAARESRTSNRAYSVRSWPSSSFHKRIKTFFIVFPFD